MMSYKMEKRLCFVFLCLLIICVYCSYLQYIIPPQMGWWNYYGWQLNMGKELYKDLYCYLPPYFVWLHGALYKLLGNHLLYFQWIGVFFTILISGMVYDLGCKIIPPVVSLIVCFSGTLVCESFLAFAPFDYNPLQLSFLVAALYFFVEGMYDKECLLYCSGAFFGILIMMKQTCMVFVLVFFAGIAFLWNRNIIQWNYRKSYKVFLGMLVTIMPGVIYLYSKGAIVSCINQVMGAIAAKGYSESNSFLFIKRIYMGLSFAEVGLAVLLILSFKLKERIRWMNGDILNFIYYSLYCLAIYKICRICYDQLPAFDLRIYCILIIMFGLINLLNNNQEINHIYRFLERKINNTDLYVKLSVLLLFVLIMQSCFFEIRSSVYEYNIVFLIKRSISNISFYLAVFGCIEAFLYNDFLRKEYAQFWIFAFGITAFQSLILIGTISLDEGYSIFSIALLLIFLYKKNSMISKTFMVIISCFLIGAVITQKQVVPYQWHGWTVASTEKERHVESSIEGLEGYLLDCNTEIAYENIISAIRTYSTPNEVVYEFPHITLFNVLMERDLGTFAVSHYIDVCPDNILLSDLDRIKKNFPRIILWNQFDKYSWKWHEQVFRNGERSASRDMLEFYEDVVENQYSLVYQYNNILVWVYNPTNEQNIKFAIEELKHVGKYYGNDEMMAILEEMNVNDFPEIRDDEINWSVHECVAKIMTKTEDFNHSVSECDYLKMFPLLNNESMRKWKMTCME